MQLRRRGLTKREHMFLVVLFIVLWSASARQERRAGNFAVSNGGTGYNTGSSSGTLPTTVSTLNN